MQLDTAVLESEGTHRAEAHECGVRTMARRSRSRLNGPVRPEKLFLQTTIWDFGTEGRPDLLHCGTCKGGLDTWVRSNGGVAITIDPKRGTARVLARKDRDGQWRSDAIQV